MISRAFLRISLTVGVVCGIPWSANGAADHERGAAASADARIVSQAQLLEILAAPFSVEIDELPAGTTAVSLQRIRYEPEVELSSQPIDGPRLLLIESGILSLEFARSGAARFPPGSSGEKAISLAAGDEHQVAAGDIVLVPAGVPLQLANRSVESVAWLQVQAETPPTICTCGEDLTGSETTLLDSQSLDRPIASPATLSIVLSELVPEQATDAPATGAVHLVGAAEAAVSLSTGSDGQLRNDSTAPIPVYIVTLGAPTTT